MNNENINNNVKKTETKDAILGLLILATIIGLIVFFVGGYNKPSNKTKTKDQTKYTVKTYKKDEIKNLLNKLSLNTNYISNVEFEYDYYNYNDAQTIHHLISQRRYGFFTEKKFYFQSTFCVPNVPIKEIDTVCDLDKEKKFTDTVNNPKPLFKPLFNTMYNNDFLYSIEANKVTLTYENEVIPDLNQIIKNSSVGLLKPEIDETDANKYNFILEFNSNKQLQKITFELNNAINIVESGNDNTSNLKYNYTISDFGKVKDFKVVKTSIWED